MAVCSENGPVSFSIRTVTIGGTILLCYVWPARAVIFDFLAIYSKWVAGKKFIGSALRKTRINCRARHRDTSPHLCATTVSACHSDVQIHLTMNDRWRLANQVATKCRMIGARPRCGLKL